MNYLIEEITEKYIEGFHSAVDSVAKERKYLAFLEGPPIGMSEEFVLTNIRENRPHYIALVDDKVIGWCDITSLNRPVYSHVGVLGMGILANFRGHGIGGALMQAALNKAQLIGLSRIELKVRENNKVAIGLYQKFGFVVEGLHRNAVKIGEDYENQISMGY